MRDLTQIIRSALLGVLPMHLVNTIAPWIAEAIVNEYGGSDIIDEEGAGTVQEHL